MRIRIEEPGDVAAVAAVHTAAFARPGEPGVPLEATLVAELRAGPAWLPELSLVAERGEDVVGHVVCTRAALQPGGHPVLGLGPLGVLPEHQKQGVGTALTEAVIAAADELGEPLIGLLGDPGYYARFGFLLAYNHGVEPPNPQWSEHFQTRPLSSYRAELRGTFCYADVFPVD